MIISKIDIPQLKGKEGNRIYCPGPQGADYIPPRFEEPRPVGLLWTWIYIGPRAKRATEYILGADYIPVTFGVCVNMYNQPKISCLGPHDIQGAHYIPPRFEVSQPVHLLQE
jgi:hypothetical protein